MPSTNIQYTFAATLKKQALTTVKEKGEDGRGKDAATAAVRRHPCTLPQKVR